MKALILLFIPISRVVGIEKKIRTLESPLAPMSVTLYGISRYESFLLLDAEQFYFENQSRERLDCTLVA